MKRSIVFLSCLLAIFAFSFTSCEGPAGQDGDETCNECHTKENMSLKSAQYEKSGHAMGANVAYAGGRKGCATCHSHEGFVETQHTGMDTTAADVPIPTAIGCETCHSGHSYFDGGDDPDMALRTTEGVGLIMFGDESSIDFGSNSNLCVNCHQPRRIGPQDSDLDEDGNFYISSSHWGPHHGPQATYVQGIGAYEASGSESYPAAGSSTHATAGGCVMCHMGDVESAEGGHTFNPTVASCTECHADATDLDINGLQTEVHELLVELEGILKAKGVVDDEGHVIAKLSHPIDLAGAYYNYIGIEEDRSLGVHNPAYIKAVLKNTIAKVK